jgi:AraC-like DNA-binding protein
MMILEVAALQVQQWKDLLDGDFQLTHVYSMQTRPRFSIQGSLSRPRPMNGLVLYLDGSAIFKPETLKLTAEPGALLYYPSGSLYQSLVTIPQTYYNQIEFMIRDPSGNPITFSNKPIVIFRNCPSVYRLKIEDMVRIDQHGGLASGIKLNALLYDLMYNLVLEKFLEESRLSGYQRILPSILYLEQHCTEPIDVTELAERSGMSVSGFRKLFRKYSGLSPMTYRNQLRIRRACDLLRVGDHNVSEVAEQTGFGSVYYFSRAFKKLTGHTPKEILEQSESCEVKKE